MTPCSLLSFNSRLGGTYRLHLQGRRNKLPPACSLLFAELISSTLKMEAKCSSETSVETPRAARRHIPEDDSLHNHRCENLKSYRLKTRFQLGYKQEVLGRTNRLLSLIRQGRRVQQFFYCCVCIRYRGDVSTEPLPSNDRGFLTDPLPSNDMWIFTEPLSSNDKGDTNTHTHTDSNVIS
jgi:hypothetical protein